MPLEVLESLTADQIEEREREVRRKARANWPVRKGKMSEIEREEEEGIVGNSIEERFGIMWDLTVTCWAFRGVDIRGRRLQRDVVRLLKRRRRIPRGGSLRAGSVRAGTGD